MKRFILLFCFSTSLQAQVMVDMPWSKDLSLPATAYALRQSSTGVISAVPGMNKPVELKVIPVVSGSVRVIFPAVTTKQTVVAVRLEVCPSAPALVCEQSYKARVPLSAPIVVGAGHNLLCQLDPNLTARQAPLNCAVDQLTVSGPITTPPPPVSPPQPVVSGCTPSPVGTLNPPTDPLIAQDCSKWSVNLSTGIVSREGVDMKNPFGARTAYIMVDPQNAIRVYRGTSGISDGVWNCWTGTAWTGAGC